MKGYSIIATRAKPRSTIVETTKPQGISLGLSLWCFLLTVVRRYTKVKPYDYHMLAVGCPHAIPTIP